MAAVPHPAAATGLEPSVSPAGAGIGLRFQHHRAFLAERPKVAWLEVHTENYMGGGTAIRTLEELRKDYPLSLHGVGLSLGSAEGLDRAHIERIRQVASRVEPGLISEHLSWSIAGGVYLADLLPLPLTEEALELVSQHVEEAQTRLGRQILIENPSSYFLYQHSTIPEWEFLAALACRSGCGILCDVNNIFVSASNHGWDPETYLSALPKAAIGEIHLAGHSLHEFEGRTLRIDDHGSPVDPEVWKLYAKTLQRFGSVPVLIEWDNNIPPLDRLLAEAAQAAMVLNTAYTEAAHANAA
jgi:uncharacterized protein (UPF0276 family)